MPPSLDAQQQSVSLGAHGICGQSMPLSLLAHGSWSMLLFLGVNGSSRSHDLGPSVHAGMPPHPRRVMPDACPNERSCQCCRVTMECSRDQAVAEREGHVVVSRPPRQKPRKGSWSPPSTCVHSHPGGAPVGSTGYPDVSTWSASALWWHMQGSQGAPLRGPNKGGQPCAWSQAAPHGRRQRKAVPQCAQGHTPHRPQPRPPP